MNNNKLKQYMKNISDDIVAESAEFSAASETAGEAAEFGAAPEPAGEAAEFGTAAKRSGSTPAYIGTNARKPGGLRTAAIAASVVLFCALGVLAALIINHNNRKLEDTPRSTVPELTAGTPTPAAETEEAQILTTVKLFVPEALRRRDADVTGRAIYDEYRNELSPVLTGLAGYLNTIPDELPIYADNTAKLTLSVTIDSPLPDLKQISRGNPMKLDAELTFSITPLGSGGFLFSVSSIDCEKQRSYYQISDSLWGIGDSLASVYYVTEPEGEDFTTVDFWEMQYNVYLTICDNPDAYYPSVRSGMTFAEFKSWMLGRIGEAVSSYKELEFVFTDYSGTFALDRPVDAGAAHTAADTLYFTEIRRNGVGLTVAYDVDTAIAPEALIIPETITSPYGSLRLDCDGTVTEVNGTRGKGAAEQQYTATYRTETNTEGETVYLADVETDCPADAATGSEKKHTRIILDGEGRRKYYCCRTEADGNLTIIEITYDGNWTDGKTSAVWEHSEIYPTERIAYYSSCQLETNIYYSTGSNKPLAHYYFDEARQFGTACFYDEEGREVKEVPAVYDFEREQWRVENG